MSTTTEAVLRWAGGTVFEAQSADGSEIKMDLPTDKGGSGAGFRPMELLLQALGACMATTMVQILAKQRLELEEYRIRLRGERTEERPQRHTRIVVEHAFKGPNLTRANLERLVDLVEEKYCAVAASLRPGLTEQRVVLADESTTVAGPKTSA